MDSFLTPDGKRLPGVTDKDSISYRIEALKVYLEQQLGDQTFLDIYKHLQVRFGSPASRDRQLTRRPMRQ